jgi:hypothetical protein
MKKLLLIAIIAVAGVAAAVAQPRAVGINIGYGIDLSYQHGLGESNMIDLSVNIPAFAGIGATCTYDWINPFGTSIPWNEKGEWNWSLGVGAGVGAYNAFSYNYVNEDGIITEDGINNVKLWMGSIYAGVVGHVGVEYNFWFPLQLSVDYRPNIGIVAGNKTVGFNTAGFYGVSLGVRYLF